MLSREGTIYLVPVEYQRLVGTKIRTLTARLKDARRNRKLYENLILKYEDKVMPNPILTGVKANVDIDYYNKQNIYDMFTTTKLLSDTNNVANVNLIVGNDRIDKNRIIVTYYEKFKRYVVLENTINTRLRKYAKLDISKWTLRYMFKNMLKYVAIFILETGKSFPLPNVIFLQILGKNKDVQLKKHNKISTTVDWKQSIDTLLAIAKDIQPTIYNDYITKKIVRKDFMYNMKPFLYHKEDRPNAPKWIVHSDKNLNFWLIVKTKYSQLINSNKYSIVPSNYISPRVVRELGIERKQSEYMKLVTSVNEIIESEYLGLRDKIAMLDKYDNKFCINTYNII
jgi:hypothetical protein